MQKTVDDLFLVVEHSSFESKSKGVATTAVTRNTCGLLCIFLYLEPFFFLLDKF